MTEARFVSHDSRAAMAEAVSAEIAAALAAALERRGKAGLVVSGGSTPKAAFERLSQAALDWERVVVTLADERWVAPDDPASNARLVHESLLAGRAAAARFLPLAEGGDSPETAAAAAEGRLDAFPWPADITILGMGTDGHTASWFPGAAALEDALDGKRGRRCLALWPDPLPADAPYPRLTLTLPAVLASRRILLLLAGAEKRTTYDRAIAGENTRAMPVRAVLHQRAAPVAIHWAP